MARWYMDDCLLGWSYRSSSLGDYQTTRRDNLTTKRDPLDVAKERYARGEINKEQFEQIKKVLY